MSLASSCRRSREVPSSKSNEHVEAAADGEQSDAHSPTRVVFATWYEVPADSLAARRDEGELTAAHNHLPLGTRVRVTHLGNGKSVVVRITDRGITGRKMKLDLSKDAAEQLGMVREGMAKVRMEILDDAGAGSTHGTPPKVD